MKKPMTTKDLFDKICQMLKDKNLYPNDLLDYASGATNPIELTNCDIYKPP